LSIREILEIFFQINILTIILEKLSKQFIKQKVSFFTFNLYILSI